MCLGVSAGMQVRAIAAREEMENSGCPRLLVLSSPPTAGENHRQHNHTHAPHDQYLNSRKICIMHRDLKPQNILISASMKAKIADFGESRHFTVHTGARRVMQAGDFSGKPSGSYESQMTKTQQYSASDLVSSRLVSFPSASRLTLTPSSALLTHGSPRGDDELH